MAFLLVLAGCILTGHTKDDKYFNIMYIALGVLILLEFKGNRDGYKTMDVFTDILIWITIAIPTIYYVFKKDVRNLAMVLVISIIFITMGLIYIFGNLLNSI